MNNFCVKLKTGMLILKKTKFEWVSDGKAHLQDVYRANEIAKDYRYTPDHGYPGGQLAQMVAKELGGTVVYPKIPDPPKGAIE